MSSVSVPHLLTVGSVDLIEKRADCAHCGRVRILLGPGGPRCINAREEARVVAAKLRRAARFNDVRKQLKTYAVNYDLSKSEVIALYELQDGLCGICGRDLTHGVHIDHDHQSGSVRGLLCPRCNHGLGMLGDREDRVIRAVKYLQHPPMAALKASPEKENKTA